MLDLPNSSRPIAHQEYHSPGGVGSGLRLATASSGSGLRLALVRVHLPDHRDCERIEWGAARRCRAQPRVRRVVRPAPADPTTRLHLRIWRLVLGTLERIPDSTPRLFLQANETRNAGIRLPGRFAQVKEETAQRAGDTEQNVQAV